MFLFSKKITNRTTSQLYKKIVQQARLPTFYTQGGIPDTVDGRFELITLHMFLVLWALKQKKSPAEQGGQALFNFMIGDMDRSLREMGVGDLSVGRKIKAMAQAFYGRIGAYEAGLTDPTPETLRQALQRNLFGTLLPDQVSNLCLDLLDAYTRTQARHILAQKTEDILSSQITFLDFGTLPNVKASSHS